jgi:DNA-binding transcriptional ArsR family regulator
MTKRLEDIISVFNKNKLLILLDLYECSDFLCGCDLVEKHSIPKNLLSYHIGQLRELGYIEEVRCGNKKQYRIASGKEDKVQKILEITELI